MEKERGWLGLWGLNSTFLERSEVAAVVTHISGYGNAIVDGREKNQWLKSVIDHDYQGFSEQIPMEKLLIICEKSSAARNFEAALGGRTGTFEGDEYKIVALAGHVVGFAREPYEQAYPNEALKSGYYPVENRPIQLQEIHN